MCNTQIIRCSHSALVKYSITFYTYAYNTYFSSVGVALVNDDDNAATVTVNGLQCQGTYSITAGGILTTDGVMDQTLEGPRIHLETIIASPCLAMSSTTTLTGKFLAPACVKSYLC